MSDDRFQEILDEIKDFRYEFVEFKTKIETELVAKERENIEHKNRTQTLEKVIFGNGQKGIKQQITEVQTKMAVVSGMGSIIGSVVITLLWKLLVK